MLWKSGTNKRMNAFQCQSIKNSNKRLVLLRKAEHCMPVGNKNKIIFDDVCSARGDTNTCKLGLTLVEITAVNSLIYFSISQTHNSSR